MIRRYGNSKVYQAVVAFLLAISVFVTVWYIVSKERKFIQERAGNQMGREERIRDIKLIDKYIDEHADDLEKITAYFSKARDTVSVIETVEALGAVYSVDLTIRQAETRTDPVAQLELIADAEGTWEQVITFIHGIEKLPHPHVVKKIDLVDVGVKERRALWRLSFVLEVPLAAQ